MQFLSTALSLCFCDVVTVYHLPQAQQRECVCVWVCWKHMFGAHSSWVSARKSECEWTSRLDTCGCFAWVCVYVCKHQCRQRRSCFFCAHSSHTQCQKQQNMSVYVCDCCNVCGPISNSVMFVNLYMRDCVYVCVCALLILAKNSPYKSSMLWKMLMNRKTRAFVC